MQIENFKEEVNLENRVLIDEREFEIMEIVRFELSDGSVCVKLFLDDGYVFIEDEQQDIFILMEHTKTEIEEPFPEIVDFDSKKYTFQYSSSAVAIEIEGDEIFPEGAKEKFWNYESRDGSYLSLGVIEETGKRMDLCGAIVEKDDVELV